MPFNVHRYSPFYFCSVLTTVESVYTNYANRTNLFWTLFYTLLQINGFNLLKRSKILVILYYIPYLTLIKTLDVDEKNINIKFGSTEQFQ